MNRQGEKDLTTDEEVKKLRTHLWQFYGTDYDASDRMLAEVARREQLRVRKTGRRWSWTVFAGEAIRRNYEGATDA